MKLTSEEFMTISLELEDHHTVFYQLWGMGRPQFTDSVETAAVSFDPQGKWVDFVFNPDFWKRLTPYQRKFVICHECLHVILNHGIRSTLDNLNHDAINACLDIVINESLVRGFEFDRAQLGTLNKNGCWVDTVFPNRTDITSDRSFEHYLNQLPTTKVAVKGLSELLGNIDDHSGLAGSVWDEVIEELDKSLPDGDKESLKDFIKGNYAKDDLGDESSSKRGEGVGGWSFISTQPVKKKKKWETVIKRWSKKYDRSEFRETEQWARLNRRLVGLSPDLMLPSEMELEHDSEGKINVWFFQDTSGSCWHLKDRFFAAARSLAPDRFNVHLFCFDTRVKEVSLTKGKIYGGGGTSFDILEEYIQCKREKGKYPEAVFVITDGYGNNVAPEKPERWYWFLSANARRCIPKESQVHMLRDFE